MVNRLSGGVDAERVSHENPREGLERRVVDDQRNPLASADVSVDDVQISDAGDGDPMQGTRAKLVAIVDVRGALADARVVDVDDGIGVDAWQPQGAARAPGSRVVRAHHPVEQSADGFAFPIITADDGALRGEPRRGEGKEERKQHDCVATSGHQSLEAGGQVATIARLSIGGHPKWRTSWRRAPRHEVLAAQW